MAFYGESWALEQAYNISGTPLPDNWTTNIYFHFDSLLATVAAGESFMCSVYPEPIELTDTDESVVSWAVETGAGSAGTLRLTSGMDPDWFPTDTSDADEPLGDFPVVGGQTIVGRTSMTTAQLLALAEEPVLLVECISGSVDVLQVKLRVWPPGGAGGAWVVAPPSELETVANSYSGAGIYIPSSWSPDAVANGTPNPVLQGGGTYASLVSDYVVPLSGMMNDILDENYGDAGGLDYTLRSNGDTTADENNRALSASTYEIESEKAFFSFIAHYKFSGLVDESPAIIDAPVGGTFSPSDPGAGFDPAEIPDEGFMRIPGVPGSVPTTTFGRWTGHIEKYSAAVNLGDGPTDLPVGSGTVLAQPVDFASLDMTFVGPFTPTYHSTVRPSPDSASSIGTISYGWTPSDPTGPSTPTYEGDISLADLPGPTLALHVQEPDRGSTFTTYQADHWGVDVLPEDWPSPPAYVGEIRHGGHRYFVSMPVGGITYILELPAYEWFNPTATPTPAIEPEFFVKTWDGRWAPVGFGKPADEPTLFHTWTPEGLYRDLTTAEYAALGEDERPPGGYQLNVKQYDDTWKQVAWLVPAEE